MFVFAFVFVFRLSVCVFTNFDFISALRTIIFSLYEPLRCYLIREALYNFDIGIIIVSMLKVRLDDISQSN